MKATAAQMLFILALGGLVEANDFRKLRPEPKASHGPIVK